MARLPLLLFLVAVTSSCSKATAELSVGAATSTRAVMPELLRAYELAHPGAHVSVTYAASGELAQQVVAGAPLDAVLFAGPRPLDDLIARGLVDASSRQVVASNELVLVAKKGAPPLTFATLTALPAGAQLAVGDPRTVPAGEYARDYLVALGEWDALKPKVVTGANVANVLVYARRAEVSAAIVYRTELRGVDDLVVLDTASGKDAPHPKIVGGVVHGARVDAGELLRFVTSPAGQGLLAQFGFGPP